jgi:hypothetical protein
VAGLAVVAVVAAALAVGHHLVSEATPRIDLVGVPTTVSRMHRRILMVDRMPAWNERAKRKTTCVVLMMTLGIILECRALYTPVPIVSVVDIKLRWQTIRI